MQLAELVGDRLKEAKRNAETTELQSKLSAMTAERDRWQHKWKIERRLSRHLTKKLKTIKENQE